MRRDATGAVGLPLKLDVSALPHKGVKLRLSRPASLAAYLA
jgi:hypothetical protein